MTFPQIDPVFLRVGPLEFRWYGLMYILSFLTAYCIIRWAVRQRELPLSADDVADLVFSVALGIILGGRLGYVLIYNFGWYLANPLKILAVWEGGMSFHGGMIGAIVAGLIYSRKKGIAPLEVADIGFLTAPVGLFLGRLGNFINGELYGRVTEVSWGVVFPGGGPLPRHPSQLYEAVLEGPVTLAILWLLFRYRVCRGAVMWCFIGLYGMFRFGVEFFREPDAQVGFVVGSLSMGQLLSLPMAVIGFSLLIIWCRKERPC
jgi:phosphatidylglycerol---prolipoprotein diacylglyceryl transferase